MRAQFCRPCTKKPEARDKRIIAPRIIKKMTRDDSCITGALLIRCIHVSMVLKEQAENRIMSLQSCPYDSSVSVPAKKSLRRAMNANQGDAASTTMHKTIAASRAHYLSAAFTSAWCSRSKRTMEQKSSETAHMRAVFPFLNIKRIR
jgi:hypothetical protein